MAECAEKIDEGGALERIVFGDENANGRRQFRHEIAKG
jgi:hypothetical protein